MLHFSKSAGSYNSLIVFCGIKCIKMKKKIIFPLKYSFANKSHILTAFCFQICLQVKPVQGKTFLKNSPSTEFFSKLWTKNPQYSPTVFDVVQVCHYHILHFHKTSFFLSNVREKLKGIVKVSKREKSNVKKGL